MIRRLLIITMLCSVFCVGEINGLRPRGSLISVTSGMLSNRTKTKVLEDVPISSSSEFTLFVKTLRDVFQITRAPSIRRAEPNEIPTFVNDRAPMGSDPTSPELVGFAITFIAEANNSKFLVLAESIPDEKLARWRPGLSWIELVDK